MLPNETTSPTDVKPPSPPSLGSSLWMAAKWLGLVCFLLLTLFLMFPVFFFIIGIVVLILLRRGETQRRMNCWTLAIAVEKQIPLDRTIASLAAESGWGMRMRLRQLFFHITAGARFEDAICGSQKVVPRFALPLFRIGCLSGRPGRAMQLICSQDDIEDYKMRQTLIGRLFYLLLCFCLAGFVALFIFIKIVPAFQCIFEDFGMSLNPLFQMLIGLSGVFYNYWYLLLPPFMLLALFCFYVLLQLLGIIALELPGMKWLTQRFHRARVQESLALAAECEMPLGDALRELAMFYPTSGIREKLSRVCNRVHSGWDWKQELRSVDLLTETEYAVVHSAEATGDLPWTLRLVAQKGRRRLMYLAQWLQQLFFVALVLGFGLMVGLLGFAMFGALTKLITALA